MIRALIITWAFAAAISLLNFSGLWPLIVTPLAPLAFERWLPFLAVPLCVAAVAALAALAVKRSAILVNIVFWLAFFGAAEGWRVLKMADFVVPENSVCSEQNSFVHSLTFAYQPYQFDVHAAFILRDRVMLWSYAEMDYFEIGPNTYRNLNFAECHDAVQALLEKTI